MKLNSHPYTKLSLTQSMTDRQTDRNRRTEAPPPHFPPSIHIASIKLMIFNLTLLNFKGMAFLKSIGFFMILSNLLKSFTLILTRTRCWGQYNADYLELGPTFTGAKIFYQIHVQTIMSIMIYIVSLYCILIKSLLRL